MTRDVDTGKENPGGERASDDHTVIALMTFVALGGAPGFAYGLLLYNISGALPGLVIGTAVAFVAQRIGEWFVTPAFLAVLEGLDSLASRIR